jgi:dolichyl-phosphate beta-glucosyltransferase
MPAATMTFFSPHLEKLISRLIRTYAPRSISTISYPQAGQRTTLNLNLATHIALKRVNTSPDVCIATPTEWRGPLAQNTKTKLVVLVAFGREEKNAAIEAMRQAAPFFVREYFNYGFFILPFLWMQWLPAGPAILRFIASLETRLHPYLNLLTGMATITVLQARVTERSRNLELTVVVPAYNEAARLPAYLRDLISYLRRRRKKFEVLVVDDGSRDETVRVVGPEKPYLRAIRLYENFGKGAAVREGIMQASGRSILVTDADGATPIAELEKLELAIKSGADIAIGSRYLEQSAIGIKQSLIRRLVSRVGNFLIRLLLDLPFRDTQCGFKLFERRAAIYVFRNLSNLRFGFDFEVLKKADVLNLEVAEIPVEWNDQDGSKVTLRQTVRVLAELLQLRFGHLLKFAFVGILNTLADFSVHNGLIFILGMGDRITQLVYMMVSFLCANLLAFCLHSGFTFQRRAAYRKFLTVSLFTLAVSALLFHGLNLLYNPANSILLNNLFKLSTVVVSFTTNYFGYRFWVYRYMA